jgi:hypothetical protein
VGTVTSGGGGGPLSSPSLCAAVTQDRALAAREHGGHVVAIGRRSHVTDRVDPGVHPPQPPVADPPVDALAVDASRDQLVAGDPSVLPRRNPRNDVA